MTPVEFEFMREHKVEELRNKMREGELTFGQALNLLEQFDKKTKQIKKPDEEWYEDECS